MLLVAAIVVAIGQRSARVKAEADHAEAVSEAKEEHDADVARLIESRDKVARLEADLTQIRGELASIRSQVLAAAVRAKLQETPHAEVLSQLDSAADAAAGRQRLDLPPGTGKG